MIFIEVRVCLRSQSVFLLFISDCIRVHMHVTGAKFTLEEHTINSQRAVFFSKKRSLQNVRIVQITYIPFKVWREELICKTEFTSRKKKSFWGWKFFPNFEIIYLWKIWDTRKVNVKFWKYCPYLFGSYRPEERKSKRGSWLIVYQFYRTLCKFDRRWFRRSRGSINRTKIWVNLISGSYNIGDLPISVTRVRECNSLSQLKSNPFGLTQNCVLL